MNQIERIQAMEQLFDETEKKLSLLEAEIETSSFLERDVHQLEEYYTSPLWRKDFEDDSLGLIPSDIKRGVLSEDGIYNLLTRYYDIIKQHKKTS